jgi:hypothetical protein
MHKFSFLLILLLIPFVSGTDFEDLSEGDSILDDHWNITILKILEDQTAVLQVYLVEDNVLTESVAFNESKKFDGINVTVTEIFYDNQPELRIIELATTTLWTHQCDEEDDCNDHDECTLDRCDGYPRKCATGSSLQNISYCKADDGCCPSACTWKTDNDCPLDTCRYDSGCNDHNIATNDSCEENRTCSFTPITWCLTGDDYCPNNCTFTMELADNRDHDCSQQSKCIANADCNDNNESTIDICYAKVSTDPKNCSYAINQLALNEEEALFKKSESREKIEYNEPPKATKKYVEEIIEKVPFVKNPMFIGLIIVVIAVYLLIIFFKFKPKPEHI